MGQQDCIFCNIVAGQIPSIKLYEDDAVLAFMDIGPISDGHTLVIPKKHYARLDQASPEALAQLAGTFPRLAEAVQKASMQMGIICFAITEPRPGRWSSICIFTLFPGLTMTAFSIDGRPIPMKKEKPSGLPKKSKKT